MTSEADFTGAPAMASLARITGGNFRLLHRLGGVRREAQHPGALW